VNLEFKELDLDWPSELTIFQLRNYILSKLRDFGEPLRWAITSVTTHSERKIQVISIEVVLIIDQDNGKDINSGLN
tara:strand:+ start:109 stop:336 length:228 start_codon:yes stop_codon:yes gene_type:complete